MASFSSNIQLNSVSNANFIEDFTGYVYVSFSLSSDYYTLSPPPPLVLPVPRSTLLLGLKDVLLDYFKPYFNSSTLYAGQRASDAVPPSSLSSPFLWCVYEHPLYWGYSSRPRAAGPPLGDDRIDGRPSISVLSWTDPVGSIADSLTSLYTTRRAGQTYRRSHWRSLLTADFKHFRGTDKGEASMCAWTGPPSAYALASLLEREGDSKDGCHDQLDSFIRLEEDYHDLLCSKATAGRVIYMNEYLNTIDTDTSNAALLSRLQASFVTPIRVTVHYAFTCPLGGVVSTQALLSQLQSALRRINSGGSQTIKDFSTQGFTVKENEFNLDGFFMKQAFAERTHSRVSLNDDYTNKALFCPTYDEFKQLTNELPSLINDDTLQGPGHSEQESRWIVDIADRLTMNSKDGSYFIPVISHYSIIPSIVAEHNTRSLRLRLTSTRAADTDGAAPLFDFLPLNIRTKCVVKTSMKSSTFCDLIELTLMQRFLELRAVKTRNWFLEFPRAPGTQDSIDDALKLREEIKMYHLNPNDDELSEGRLSSGEAWLAVFFTPTFSYRGDILSCLPLNRIRDAYTYCVRLFDEAPPKLRPDDFEHRDDVLTPIPIHEQTVGKTKGSDEGRRPFERINELMGAEDKDFFNHWKPLYNDAAVIDLLNALISVEYNTLKLAAEVAASRDEEECVALEENKHYCFSTSVNVEGAGAAKRNNDDHIGPYAVLRQVPTYSSPRLLISFLKYCYYYSSLTPQDDEADSKPPTVEAHKRVESTSFYLNALQSGRYSMLCSEVLPRFVVAGIEPCLSTPAHWLYHRFRSGDMRLNMHMQLPLTRALDLDA